MRIYPLFLLPGALFGQSLMDLDQWQANGDGIWTITKEKVLIGQRKPVAEKERPREGTPEHRGWYYQQAWLYTKAEFGDFDLSFEYWIPVGSNSGIALRDPSRGAAGVMNPPDYRKTPSKVAYEIQLNNRYPDQHLSGSIYGLAKAPAGLQNDLDWNRMEIRAREGKISIFLNGKLAAEHAAPADRPRQGPIGLQLHDQHSVAMFRNIRVTSRQK
jgi:hypothetical protein